MGITKMNIGKAIDCLSLWFSYVAALAIVIMLLTMVFDAFTRKFIGSVPGAFETSKVLLVAIAYLPQGFVQLKRRHISVDIVQRRLPRKTQAIINGIGALFGSAFFALLTWLTLVEAWRSTVRREFWMSDMDYPIWQWRWLLPIGVAILAIQLLRTSGEEFRKVTRRD
ncbi:MAG: hypothetical protein A2157_19220 [Deltaproteobacteria bacterium RBG_16_47_11]|nr:MAG: hypothetical protein A2157_19220 [Deltaproteobacteria bacterium RBG_16_47_11]